MTLHDYISLMSEGEELTVWDKDYDMETYFYNDKPCDRWDKSISVLSKLLEVKEIRSNGVIVNLSEIIENKLDNLDKAELFVKCNIDSIMYSMGEILSGNVSENWMEKFVAALK